MDFNDLPQSDAIKLDSCGSVDNKQNAPRNGWCDILSLKTSVGQQGQIVLNSDGLQTRYKDGQGDWSAWKQLSTAAFLNSYTSLSDLANALGGLNRFAITNSQTLTEAEFVAKGSGYDSPWGYTPYIVFAHGVGADEDYNDYDMKIFYRAPTVQAVSASLMSSPTGVRIADMGVLTGQTQGRTYKITIMPLWAMPRYSN